MPTNTSGEVASTNVAICDFLKFPHLKLVTDVLVEALEHGGYSYLRYPTPEAFAAAHDQVARADVIVGFGSMPVPQAVIDAAPQLRGVVSCVSGTEGIDMDAATKRGVLVAHAPTPENIRGMAEAAVMLILNLMYDLDGTRENMRRTGTRPVYLKARVVKGKTIGLVGYGRIASTLATLLSTWDVNLLVYSRRAPNVDVPANARLADIDELMRESDVVCVLAGLDANSRGFVNDERIRMMKKDAFLVNLSRGSILDEAAVTAALHEGRIAGAALDVFATEPLPATAAIRGAPNTILTPHHVGHNQETDESLFRAVLENVMPLLEGRLPGTVKNREAIDAWRRRWEGKAAPRLAAGG